MSANVPCTLRPRAEAEAGVPVRGDFRCGCCGYGVSVVRALPHCPMCGASDWAPAPRMRVSRFHVPMGIERSGEPVVAPVVSGGRAAF